MSFSLYIVSIRVNYSERDRKSNAAKKIQDLFRRKKEEKERAKVMEVPQAKVLMKYSGHRNCRTMVCHLLLC